MLFNFLFFVIVYCLLEFVYLKCTTNMYKAHFAKIQSIHANDVLMKLIPYGVLTYIVLFTVIWYFVVRDIFYTKHIKITDLMTRATLLAIAIYGVYNLTNAATLKNYSLSIIIQDTLWGIFALNVVTMACYFFNQLILLKRE